MNISNSSTAIKRVYKDLKELDKSPISGISLCLPCPSDPFTIHANLEIQSGIYEGILLHLIIHIPPDYPINAPAVNIAPGLNFGHKYHAHIFDDYTSGNSICTDITSNFMGHFKMIDGEGKPARSGWTSAYTLTSVLLQLQVFFSEPDLSENSLPSKNAIEALRAHVKEYELEIMVEEGNSKVPVRHTYEHPFPYLELQTKKTQKIELVKISDEKINAPLSGSCSNRSLSTKADEIAPVEPSSEIVMEKIPEPRVVVNEWAALPMRKKNPGAPKTAKAPHSAQVVSVKGVEKILPPPIEDKPTPKKLQHIHHNPKPEPKFSRQSYNTTRAELTRPKVINTTRFQVQDDREEEKVDVNSDSAWARPLVKNPKSTTKPKSTTFQSIISSSIPSTSKVSEENVPIWRRKGPEPPKPTQRIIIKEQSELKPLSDTGLYRINSTTIEDPSKIKEQISEKLLCSVFKTDVFDESKPILGFPIDLEKDKFGRFWPTPVMEIMSYDAFVQTIQEHYEKLDNFHSVKFRSSFGNAYNYWLPIYINEEHFNRASQHILNSIAVICTGIEGKAENDFKPEMILKVMPAILVKTFIHFLNGTLHQSIVGIEAYFQFYRLFIKLINIFPELRTKIDKDIENFMASEDNRHKNVAGDLGEFMIKMGVSSYGINNTELNMLLFKEHLTRQVRWVIRADRSITLKHKCDDLVQKFVKNSKVSDQFHLVQMEMVRLLLDDEVEAEMNNRCGYLDEERLKIFLGRIDWIKRNIGQDWSQYVLCLGLQRKIGTEKIFRDYLLDAIHMSAVKSYF